MSTLLLVAAAVVGLGLLGFAAMTLSLVRAVGLTERGGAMIVVEARLVDVPPSLELTIAAGGEAGTSTIRVESITLPRRVVDALGARPPAGFRLSAGAVMDRAAFEPDLEELADAEPHATPERIERVTEQQYAEYRAMAEAHARESVTFEGRLEVRPARPSTLTVPLARTAPVAGDVILSCSRRVGLTRVASGAAAPLSTVRAPDS